MESLYQQLCSSLDSVTAEGNTYVFTTNAHTPELLEYLQDDYNFETTVRYLTLKEQLRVKASKSKVKALITSLFTRLVLNYFIQKDLKSNLPYNPWEPVRFKYNKYGKPFLDHQIFFNSSSSNDIITITVSLVAEVGVDLSHAVQESISSEDFMDQFSGIFHPDDLRSLNSVADIEARYIAFNQLWTLKESFTKLIGSGLNIDLQQVGFYFSNDLQLESSLHYHDTMLQLFTIDWSKDINITVEKDLQNHELLDMDKGSFRAVSGCLVLGKGLPVLISVVSQHTGVDIRGINLNFMKILTFLQY